MNYKKIYNQDYFSGKDSFFYSLGYGRSFQNVYFQNIFNPLKKYLRDIKKGKVLDIGCAYGIMLKKFPTTFEKFGIDISKHAIDEAKKRMPEATFKVAGAEDPFPFPKSSFDVIISNDVLEHLENPRAALEHMHAALKRHGILYVNTPNFNWLRKNFFAYADKREHHISLFPHRKLEKLLEDVGFEVIDHWTYTSIPFFFFLAFRSNLGHESAFICRKK